jgi:hypothetical protein
METVEQISNIALSALLDSPKNSASLMEAVPDHVLFNALMKQVFELLLRKEYIVLPTSNIDTRKLDAILSERGKRFILEGGFKMKQETLNQIL